MPCLLYFELRLVLCVTIKYQHHRCMHKLCWHICFYISDEWTKRHNRKSWAVKLLKSIHFFLRFRFWFPICKQKLYLVVSKAVVSIRKFVCLYIRFLVFQFQNVCFWQRFDNFWFHALKLRIRFEILADM